MPPTVFNLGESARYLSEICYTLGYHFLHLTREDPQMKSYIDGVIEPTKYHTFFPTDSIMDLLELTDNKVFARPLPFDRMFIPIRVTGNNSVMNGIIALHLHENSDEEVKALMGSGVVENNVVIIRRFEYVDNLGEGRVYLTVQVILKDGSTKLLMKDMPTIIKHDVKKILKYTNNLFFNTIDFLNHPEVKMVVCEHTKNSKRLKKAKVQIPPRIKITVTGKIKSYLDAVQSRPGIDYAHSFWVRGHFRHFTSDYYNNMKGKAIWIMPFIKGDGELIKKVYEMKKLRK